MICANCGSQILPEQKFCRSCGASLHITTQPLSQSDIANDLKRGPTREAKTTGANRGVFWGFIAMFLGVAISVIGKKLIYVDVVTVIGVVISLLGMFISVFPYLSPSRRRKHDLGPSAPAKVLAPSQPTRSLPPQSVAEYVPSVTERTTDLLKNSADSLAHQKEQRESEP